MIRISFVAAVIASLAGAPGRAADRFDTKAVDFALAFKGETSAYRDVAMFVMPGESVTLDVYRDKTKLTVKVKLGRQPATPP